MTLASTGHHLEIGLIYCNGCGTMGANSSRFGWKRFSNGSTSWQHHCTRCQDDFRVKYDKEWDLEVKHSKWF